MAIYIIGRRPSKSILSIVKNAGIPRYSGRKSDASLLINYGLAGDHLEGYYKKFPSARRIPTINKRVGYSKLSALRRISKANIDVPESKTALTKSDKIENFIEKRLKSIGGIGIRKARGKKPIPGKYYQRFIEDRIYELRVHAFKWIDLKEWVVQKRIGPEDAIAWNFKQGGSFVTIHNPRSYKVFKEAQKISSEVLDILNMSFGAVDFIVDKNHRIYFIEINSAPGFLGLSDHIYIDAFNKLKKLKKKEISAIT